MIIRRKSVIGALRFIVTMLSRHDMRARVSAMLTFANRALIHQKIECVSCATTP